jgi:protein-tyrosine phosphatase
VAVTRRLLVVCTANVCRSPVVADLLVREFAHAPDIDGETWVATSAGTGRYAAEMDERTIRAAAEVGLDIRAHRPRHLDRDMLATEGADLVVTLERAHLRDVVGLDPSAWPRSFTLKELARRAVSLEPPTADEGFAGWRRRVADGRSAAAMLDPDPADDVADPYGRPLARHVRMVAEVAAAVDQLIRWGPWRPLDRGVDRDDHGDPSLERQTGR